ncbi:MAG: LysM peptidoglycan-binding domain-containing protein [Anaerolineae bacterium]|nr:LysM peptidoglycan-binding domain-containing protein [Anaerolineae bacterium]
MTKTLLFKTLAVILAVVLLQIAVAADSQAQGYGSDGYGGGWGGGFYYTVRYGDTLFAICRKFGVDPYEIARINGLPNPNHIYAGQVLYIPAGSGYCPTCWANYHHPWPKPVHWQHGCGDNCYQQPVKWHGCGKDCYRQGYGYDYTGYYYEGYYPHYQRYSYTCGYNYNCY